ncbi:MAG TPA: aminopeptidase [Phycisphaerae bacterium]|jgi:predicted aminopeptidase|nr:aminopeptidase [Phycisphaerae bacterium]HOB75975.1 aminopeptidase [Phycisphaerae bacterium]HOJ55848.1 aminopeptidase [Phycisphaerae bacterium]HOL27821.1 aminopeptidase [Phycisphaerae bacterium]HPP22250.1 aminopeptidase [Phycisphaerae bacterium]
MFRPHRILSLVFLSCLAVAGCGDTYIGSVILGELRLLASVRPVEEALNDPNLAEEKRLKLAFVVRARDYAQNVVGLHVGGSYQTFADLGDRSLAWNLSASRRDAFDPYIWRFPLAGSLPYIGFFDLDQAKAERDRLVAKGYDTLIYEIDAYSTMGQLPDPITSALLRRDFDSLAETVIHELTHNTIYTFDDITFNESLATFVGRTAGLDFLAQEFGPDAPEIEQARLNYEDQDRFQVFLREMRDGLAAIYETDLSFDEKIAQREAYIAASQQRFAEEVLPFMHNQAGYQGYTSFPFNNAFILAHVRYNSGQDAFAAVYEQVGRNWAEALQIFRQAAASENPMEHLRGLALE